MQKREVDYCPESQNDHFPFPPVALLVKALGGWQVKSRCMLKAAPWVNLDIKKENGSLCSIMRCHGEIKMNDSLLVQIYPLSGEGVAGDN